MEPAKSDERPVSDDQLYQEAGRAWQHFASWREKAFAGYLTVLAALMLVFSRYPTVPMRIGVLASCILVSAVFWILEDRSRRLIRVCQAAAAKLEGGAGCHAALDDTDRPDKTLLTFGFAVGLLVSGVSAASIGGIGIYLTRWSNGDSSMWPACCFGIALILFPALAWMLHQVGDRKSGP